MQNKIGFIGAGNMATAIIKGILAKDFIAPSDIFVYDILPGKLKYFKDLGANSCDLAQDIVNACDYIFLATKPQNLKDSLKNLKIDDGKCVISIAAGVDIATIKSCINPATAVVRAMPNTPILVGRGATAIALSPEVTPAQADFVTRLFETCGICRKVDENAIDTVTAISGSGPAYFFEMAKAAAEFAKSTNLLDLKIANELFAQTMIGAGIMLLESGKSPEELIAAVASKGGTTEAALKSFGENNFEEIIIEAMIAAKNKADELAK